MSDIHDHTSLIEQKKLESFGIIRKKSRVLQIDTGSHEWATTAKIVSGSLDTSTLRGKYKQRIKSACKKGNLD